MSVVHLSEVRSDADDHLTMPVSDRATVGVAVGMAIAGAVPVVELSSTGRLLAVLEPLAEAASVAAAGEFSVPLVVRVPYGGQAGGRVDRPVLDTLASVEGLRVVVASDKATADALLDWAIEQAGPTVLLEPRAMPEGAFGPGDDGPLVHRMGEHVTLVAYGTGVHAALDAAQQLDQQGIGSTVIQLVRTSPLPIDDLGEAVNQNGRVIAIGDEPAFNQRVIRAVVQAAFLYLESPPASAPADATAIAAAARDSVTW